MRATSDISREFGTFQPVAADTPGYNFSKPHLACPRSHATLDIEINSDDLTEVEDIAKCAVEADFPRWKLNYLKVVP